MVVAIRKTKTRIKDELEVSTEGKELRCGVPGGGTGPRLQMHRNGLRAA